MMNVYFVLILLSVVSRISSDRIDHKTVVFISSYEFDLEHTIQQDRGAVLGMMRNSFFEGVNLNITRYHMNVNTEIVSPSVESDIVEKIWNSMNTFKYDALVLFDDSAVIDFGVRFYFNITVPIFFCGLNMSPEQLNTYIPIMDDWGRLHPSGNVTGMHEEPYFYHTLEIFGLIFGDLENSTVPLIFDSSKSSIVKSDVIQKDFYIREEAEYVRDKNIKLVYYTNISTFEEYKETILRVVQDDPNVKTYFNNAFSLQQKQQSSPQDEIFLVDYDEIIVWTIENIFKPEISSKTDCEAGYFGGAASDTYGSKTIDELAIHEPPSVIYFNLDRVRQLKFLLDNETNHMMDQFLEFAMYVFEKESDEIDVIEKTDYVERLDAKKLLIVLIPIFCIFTSLIFCFVICIICFVSFLLPTTKFLYVGLKGKLAQDLMDVDPQALEMFLLEYYTTQNDDEKTRKTEDDQDILEHFIQVDPKLFRRLLIPSTQLECVTVIRSAGLKRDTCSVYLAKWKPSNRQKKLEKLVVFKYFTSLTRSIKKQFVMEFNVLVQTTIQPHPNIIKFHGVVLEKSKSMDTTSNINKIGLVLEYCEGGNIDEFLNKNKEIQLETKIRFLLEISDACSYLHHLKIIHRDLKPQNVLLSKFLDIKVIDFGLSKYISQDDVQKTQRIGTSFWMAPEIVLGGYYTESVDVFSFGVIAYQLFAHTCDPYGIFESIEQGGSFIGNIELKVANDPSFRPDISKIPENTLSDYGLQSIIPMIQNCWNHEPLNRPTFREISKELQKGRKRIGTRLNKTVLIKPEEQVAHGNNDDDDDDDVFIEMEDMKHLKSTKDGFMALENVGEDSSSSSSESDDFE